MRLTEYGPGDYQTWGGCSPEPSDYGMLYEQVSEKLSENVYEALYDWGFEDLHDAAISGPAFEKMVRKKVEERIKQAEEDRAAEIISAREWD